MSAGAKGCLTAFVSVVGAVLFLVWLSIKLTEHSLGEGLAGFVGASTCWQVVV